MNINSMEIYVGTDIEKVEKFASFVYDKSNNFLQRIFNTSELDYCFSKADPKQHLTARYAAKESIVKALSSSGIEGVDYKDIIIANDEKGVPLVKITSDIVSKNIKVRLSLSHTDETAIAFSLIIKN